MTTAGPSDDGADPDGPAQGPSGDLPPRAPRLDAPALAVAIGGPVLGALAVAGAAALWAERLPDPVATHWSPAGAADGWSSLPTFATGMALMAGLLPLALGLAAGFGGVWVSVRRALLGIGTGTAVFVAAVTVQSLAVQLDGQDPVLPFGSVLGPAAAALVVGVIASRVPRDLRVPVVAAAPPPRHLPRSAARTVAAHPVGMGGRLSADDDGVTVRWLGTRAVHVDVEEVTAARAVTVSAWDFGGWGLRMGLDGRYAFIGSGSSAVELRCADGTTWLVTTSRAEEMAGVVNAAADRRFPGPSAAAGPRA